MGVRALPRAFPDPSRWHLGRLCEDPEEHIRGMCSSRWEIGEIMVLNPILLEPLKWLKPNCKWVTKNKKEMDKFN